MKRSFAALAAILGPIALATALFSPSAFAARTVNFYATASNTDGGVNVSYKDSSNEADYEWTINDGQSVVDKIPVRVCRTTSSDDTVSPYWVSIDIAFNKAGGLPGVTVPGNETFSRLDGNGSLYQLPTCRDVEIQVSTGPLVLNDPLVAQNFVLNINLASDNPNPPTGNAKPNVNFYGDDLYHYIDNLKLTVVVMPLPEEASNVSCFLSNSAGLLLKDCDGEDVSESASNEGRFLIVANKKKPVRIEVSTNPGQFYYNLVWWNKTGATQAVDVVIDLTGVHPHGTQAMHTEVFNGYLDGVSLAEFAQVNINGVPQGDGGSVTAVEVPDGSSLVVTYHLEWDGIGDPVPAGCATDCPSANQLMSVMGTVSGTGIDTESCTAEAYGFLYN